VFKIQESATDFSGADITAYPRGLDRQLRLRRPPTRAGSSSTAARGRHPQAATFQYLITTGATTLVSVNWVLGRANQMPDTNTEPWASWPPCSS